MDKETKFIIVLLGVIIVAALGLVLIFGGSSGGINASEPGAEEVGDLSAELGELSDVKILGITAYSGPYFEDGSNEEVSGVMQLTVQNTGSEDYQLLNLVLTDENGKEFTFKITTLLQGETLVVLEENRALLSDAAKLVSVRLGDVAIFGEAPSVHADTFAFMVNGNNVTVQNLTDSDYGTVKVFYKNYTDGVALGGITYSITISGLPAGESANVSTGNFNENTSKFVFVVYG